jgi:hypothetical protein
MPTLDEQLQKLREAHELTKADRAAGRITDVQWDRWKQRVSLKLDELEAAPQEDARPPDFPELGGEEITSILVPEFGKMLTEQTQIEGLEADFAQRIGEAEQAQDFTTATELRQERDLQYDEALRAIEERRASEDPMRGFRTLGLGSSLPIPKTAWESLDHGQREATINLIQSEAGAGGVIDSFVAGGLSQLLIEHPESLSRIEPKARGEILKKGGASALRRAERRRSIAAFMPEILAEIAAVSGISKLVSVGRHAIAKATAKQITTKRAIQKIDDILDATAKGKRKLSGKAKARHLKRKAKLETELESLAVEAGGAATKGAAGPAIREAAGRAEGLVDVFRPGAGPAVIPGRGAAPPVHVPGQRILGRPVPFEPGAQIPGKFRPKIKPGQKAVHPTRDFGFGPDQRLPAKSVPESAKEGVRKFWRGVDDEISETAPTNLMKALTSSDVTAVTKAVGAIHKQALKKSPRVARAATRQVIKRAEDTKTLEIAAATAEEAVPHSVTRRLLGLAASKTIRRTESQRMAQSWLGDQAGSLLWPDYARRWFGAAGKSLAQKTDNAVSRARLAVGRVFSDMREPILRLTERERFNLTNVLDGREAPISARVAELAPIARRHFDEAVRAAQDAGIPVIRRENYITQVWRDGALEAFLGNKVDIKRAADAAGIPVTKMEEFLSNQRRAFMNRKSMSLDYQRQIDLPDWAAQKYLERDFAKLSQRYFDDAWRRTAFAEQFGPKNERVRELVELASKEGFDAENFGAIARQMTGETIFEPKALAASKWLRSLQVLTKMSMSGLNTWKTMPNLAVLQGAGPVRIFSETLPDIVRSFSRDGTRRAIASGEIRDLIIRSAGDIGEADFARKMLDSPLSLGFNYMEFAVRRATIVGAQNHAKRMTLQLRKYGPAGAEKGWRARSLLTLLNSTGDDVQAMAKMQRILARGELTQQELNAIGEYAVRLTQPISPTDVPHYAMKPFGRVISQFNVTSLKEFRFTLDHVLKEAARGNPRPAISLFMAGQVFGEGIGNLGQLISGRKRPGWEKPFLRMAGNVLDSTGIGPLWDIILSARFGRGWGLMGWLLGPTVESIVDGINALYGGNVTKEVTKRVPAGGVQRRAAEALAPSKRKRKSAIEIIMEDDLGL